ncbi:MAG: ATP-dependent Clp protease ATP-binding subunit [Clostridia bacterium]|nr:ATP-dependent Clp protease ATP-binding subunit [Clostridia bacterium]
MNENNFTQKAREAIRLSQIAAQETSCNFVGTEHLLLGLLKEGSSFAAKFLSSLNITEEKVKEKISEATAPSQSGFAGFTPRTTRCLQQSAYEARKTYSSYIGTEHILLAILRERDSVAFRILLASGVPVTVYNDLLEAVTKSSSNAKGEDKAAEAVKNTPTLNQFGRDLTRLASEDKFDPVIGRSEEIARVIQILSRRTKNNPVLLGEPGVGKTAIAEGLAQEIVSGNVPELLKNKRVFSVDLSGMVAGAKYRGEFEERLKKAMEEVTQDGNVILFIDEIHTIIGAGAAEGAIDAANILKPALARGEIQLIGATTLNEYRKYIEKDAALERRFQSVMVGEPSIEDTVEILKGLRPKYEAHHGVKIEDNALEAAAKLSSRYITDRFLPDKAIDLVDEAASRTKLKKFTAPPELKELEDKIKETQNAKHEAINSQDFEKAATLRDEEKSLTARFEKMRSEWSDKTNALSGIITETEIASIISSWTNIPVDRLREEESDRLRNLESVLHKRVIGQHDAVVAISRAIRRGRVGLKDPKRPIGSFIFLGPTGVGKTELTKALAEALFGDEDAMIRVDMSEFMEKHSVSKLVGSPPGYVGYDDAGQLTEKVRRKPYSVILFDEIEKAHPDVFNILLQVLEDGILTDSQGKKVDFRNTVIIMTSNVGASKLTQAKRVGFGEADTNTEIKKNVMDDLKKTFRPEFLNRLDEIIVFNRLTEEEIKQIAKIMLSSVSKRLEENGIHVTFNDTAVSLLSKEGFDPVYGARPLRRAITSKIEDLFAEEILSGNVVKGDKVSVSAKGDKFVINQLKK